MRSVPSSTFAGFTAVIVWGLSLPVARLLYERIGFLAAIGVIFGAAGLFGLVGGLLQGSALPPPKVFRERSFYLRWLFFLGHEVLINIAVQQCRRQHMPFVILLNYLWPTAVLICSILLAGLRVTRPWAFISGTLIVLASLTFEILSSGVGTHGFEGAELFAEPRDVLAYGLAFLGALSWGLYSAVTRRSGEASGGGKVVPIFQLTMALAAPLSLAFPHHGGWGLSAVGNVLVLGYCILAYLAYRGWDHAVRNGNVVLLSLAADFIPWLSLASAALLLDVPIRLHTVMSAISLVIGAVITRYGTLGLHTPPKAEIEPTL